MEKFYSSNQNLKKSSFFVRFFTLISFCLIACCNIFAQTVTPYSTAGSFTFTVPAGVTSMFVQVWGGGGGGGGCNSVIGTSGGSGGGGGGYSAATYTVVPTNVYNITVGAGGTAASDANGGNGGSSTVTGTAGTLTGTFGSGGARRGGAAGAAGTGSSANGVAGTTGTGGAGGAAGGPGGTGGGAQGGNGSGNAGNPPGGGGGGGRQSLFNGAKSGGAGGVGRVVISYCLNPTIATLPAAACAGTTITLTGTNFITGSTTVTFNGIASPAVTVSSATSLTAQIPPAATSGPIVISTLYGATSAPSASYSIFSIPNTPASTLSSNSPQCSPSAVTVSSTGSPTGGDIWYWQTANNGTSTSIGSGSTVVDNVVGTRTYYLRALNSGCWSANSTSGASITINPAAPASTSVSICAGQSDALTSSTVCGASSSVTSTITSSATINGSSTSSAAVSSTFTLSGLPAGATITNIAWSSSQAVTTDWMSELRFEIIKSGSTTISIQNSTSNSAGTVTQPAGSSATFGGTAAGTYTLQWRDITSPYNVTVTNQTINVTVTYSYLSTDVQWSTSIGGAAIYTGSPFNPVGVAGSGLTNTLSTGTTTFYAFCPYNPTCRTSTNFVINTGPTQYTVTGGGTYCTDGIGLPVGLSGSQSGVSYQLLLNGTNSGSPVAGTGSVISFGNRTGAGTYTVLATNSGCTDVPMTGSVTITALAASPTTTPVSICTGQSGTLALVSSCATVPQTPITASGSGGTSNSTSYSNTNITINFPSVPPGAVITNITTTITYTSNTNIFATSYRSELRVRVTPPVAVGSQVTDIQPSTNASAGTETNLAFGSWSTGNPTGNWLFEFRETTNESDLFLSPDANINNITITVAYSYAGALWYTTSSGGTQIGGGTSFNPVGVSGSGLSNTLTPGTTTYYAACPANTTCRTATNFVINAALTISAASSSPSLCQNTPLTAITHTTTSVSGIASSTGLPAGVTASYASNTITISGTPTASGTFNYTITPTGCGSATATGTITVNPGAVPASVASASGATLVVGDLLWSGNSSVLWGLNSNWYVYDGTNFVVPGIGVSPAASNRVFVLPSSTSGICISGTNSSTVTASGAAKDVFIGTGATMVINAGQSLQVNGDWTNNGTFTPDATGTVEFVGGTAQSIGGSSAINFTNLTLNKSANTLTLNTPVNISGTFTMTAGNISSTSTNLLTVGTSTAVPGSIAWTNGTVVGPLKRYFSGTASGTQASGIFPIGLSGVNRYAQVNYTAGLSTGGSITAEYKSGVCPIGNTGLPATINGQLIQNYEDEGYWEITPNGGDLNSATYSLILRGNGLSTVTSIGHMSKLRIIKSVSHTTWDNSGLGSHSAPIGGVSDVIISNSGMTGFSFFNIGSENANPLPVTMLDFAANCNEKSEVDVKWTTASEQSSESFIVERSRDLAQWEFIATVNAAGNSNYNIDYATIDADPFGGVSYYRLVQMDNNGDETIYGPISVSCSESENNMIVFPNPTKGNFTIEIFSALEIAQTTLVITDLSGKMIANKVVDIKEGKNQVYFNELGLQLGTYIVSILKSENQIKPMRFVVNE